MEAEVINLDDWYASGRGGYADSYFHKKDESLILKLNFNEYPAEKAYEEYSRSRAVFELGVPCPEPVAFVTDGERYGLISRRIVGKKSLTRIMSEDPSRTDEMARKLAGMAKELHSRPCNTDFFESLSDRYRRAIDRCPQFPDDVREKLRSCLDEMKPCTTCLHYDLHPGNVITAGGSDYWIDLGDFGYGDPDLDFGILIVLSEWTPKMVLDDLLHISRKQCRRFTKLYGEYYYGEQFHNPELLRKLYHAALLRYAYALTFSEGSIAPLICIFRGQRFRSRLFISILDLFVKERKHD